MVEIKVPGEFVAIYDELTKKKRKESDRRMDKISGHMEALSDLGFPPRVILGVLSGFLDAEEAAMVAKAKKKAAKKAKKAAKEKKSKEKSE